MCIHVAEKVIHTSRFAFMMDSVPLMCKAPFFLNSTRLSHALNLMDLELTALIIL